MRPTTLLLTTLSASFLALAANTSAAPDILIEKVDIIDVEAKTFMRDTAIAIAN